MSMEHSSNFAPKKVLCEANILFKVCSCNPKHLENHSTEPDHLCTKIQ